MSAPAAARHDGGGGLTFVFSSYGTLPERSFQGYAFVGADLVVGPGGAARYHEAQGRSVPPGEDGCYITVRRGPDGPEIGVDHAGLMKLFCFADGDVWCVSNSLVRMVDHLRDHGHILQPNPAQLVALRLPTTFVEQLSTPTTVFRDIRLVPRGRKLVLTRSGLAEVRVTHDEPALPYPDALVRYLSVWHSRIGALLDAPDTHVSADLSGGIDSRVVHAQVVAAAGGRPLDDLVQLVSGRSTAQQADFAVASQLAERQGAHLNRREPSGLPEPLGDVEAFEGWRDLCLGVYLPIYFPRVRLTHRRINLSGLGGENHRPFYPQRPSRDFVDALRTDAPADLLEQWRGEVVDLLDRWQGEDPTTHPLVRHYREFRGRIHGGLFAQSKINITPLGSRWLEEVPVQLGRQVYFDAMESLLPGLMDIPFDSAAKAPNERERNDLTRVRLPSDLAPGEVYAAPEDEPLAVTGGPSPVVAIQGALVEADTPAVRDLLGDKIVDDARELMAVAVERNALGNARRASNVSRVLTTAFVLGAASPVIRPTVRPMSLVHGEGEPATSGGIEAAEGGSAALLRARELTVQGEHDAAGEVLRRHLLHAPRDLDAWWHYGSVMTEQGNPGSGAEAAKNVLDADPLHLGGLELLVQTMQHNLPGMARYRKKVLPRLVDGLPGRPTLHRTLVSYLVAERHQRGLRCLSESPDQITRLVVTLNAVEPERWPSILADVPPTVGLLAEIHTLLGRGGAVRAAALIAELGPDLVPLYELRIAVHRLLGARRLPRARLLLQQYLRVRPDDSWARSRLRSTQQVPSPKRSRVEVDDVERRLLAEGFRFPPASPARTDSQQDRVLYAAHNSLPFHSAGYATRSHGLLSALVQDGWRTDVVTRLGYPFDLRTFRGHPEIDAVEEIDGLTYRRLTHVPVVERRRPIDAYVGRYADALVAVAERERPAVLHAASNHVNGLATVSAARRLGVPSVYEVRGLWEITRLSREPEWGDSEGFQFTARMEAEAAMNATRVVAITHALRSELISRGVDAENIAVVPNGVDTDRFVPRPPDRELAARLGVADKTVIGYVGSVLDYEGLCLLVEAASALAAERDDFAVLVVGDGAHLSALQRLVAERSAEHVVRFLGRVPHDEVEPYYSIMDICPLPRLPLPVTEMVSPLKPFEAMAMGRVVVASDVAALAEIVTDGQNGILHEKGSVESLTSKLRLLLDDPGLRDRLARQAREWVVQNRRWDVLAKDIAAVWEDLGAARIAGATAPARMRGHGGET